MALWSKEQNSLLPEQLLKQLSVIASNLICGVEQDGRGVGGHGVHLSQWIHQDYTFRHRSACRTPAESRQEYPTTRKEYISSVQSLSRVWLFATPWIAACQAFLSITNSRSLPKPMPIESVMPSSHLILCRPLLMPPVPPSIRVFSNESTLRMRWPKYWSFSFSIRLSNEHPGLISFRMDWLDLLAVQGTLKSLLQHHSSKASIFRHSAFFTV